MSKSTESQSGYAELSDGQLFFESKGEGDVIVFIHGNAGDRRHWDLQFEAFSEGFRVVRYDVRGFGKSSLPVEDRPYSDYEDLAELLDCLGVRKAHIAGWSMGSGIAVDFALAYPERTSSLIAIGPWVFGYSSPGEHAMMADMLQIANALAEGGQEAAVEAWMNAPFFSETIVDPGAGERFRRITEDHSFWAFAHRSRRRMLKPSAVGRVEEIEVPTLVLTAKHDTVPCLEIAQLLENSVADVRKIVMEDAGHLLHMEKPEVFNQHLLEFVDTLSRT